MHNPNKPRVSGALFENLRDTGPAFKGFVEIDGVKTQIVLWPKTSAKGQNYLQVAEDKRLPQHPREQGRLSQIKPRNDPRDNSDMDDELPDF
jgi:hypothetical protein